MSRSWEVAPIPASWSGMRKSYEPTRVDVAIRTTLSTASSNRDEHAHFPTASHEAQAGGLRLARSWPCFEFWLLLHFTYHRRPYVLWICTDQQRTDTIAPLGNPQVRTPALDSLVRDAVALRNVYFQSPFYSSSRASFMTGRGPSQTTNY